MFQRSETDDDTASILSASSAHSYNRRKKAKERPNVYDFQVPMSASDYSDYSRYPRLTTKSVEPEGPGIRMRATRTYDDNVIPAGYHPVTTTFREHEAPHPSRRHHRSSSSTSPRVQHELKAVPNPAAPGGVTPHVVTHVHLPSPRRSRRHRSASREPPPVASRPAYGRRRSRSYDDSYRSQTHIINLPPPPVASNPGFMYNQPQPLPHMRPLPASSEFGYGRPAPTSSGYGGTPRAPGPSAAMAASAPGSAYPSSRRRAVSNAYTLSPTSPMSPYGGASPMGMGGQYSPYGPSAAPSAASQMYPAQSGYGSPMGSTAAPVITNVPSTGSMMAQQPMMTGSRRAHAMSMNGMGMGANPYGSSVTAPGAGVGNLAGGMGNYPAPHLGGAYGGGGYGAGGVGGSAYGEGNPYGAGNIGYGQSANGVYGYGPGQARDPSPGGTAPSQPHSQRPPGTGFFGGLFGRRSPGLDASGIDGPYAQNQDHGRHRRRYHN